uniref:Uncharacterized protein n=1 Tax=uncultured Armatimonadetes bacterium TaxID=157466 RepID=A0A6J4JZ96_9BACT|nr:hypothetical protein AVDCRST_MAG63-4374 [uncultured Armatimonadetes bacterium]
MADQDKTDSAEQANANASASTVGNPQDEDVDRQDSATATGSNPHYSTARDNPENLEKQNDPQVPGAKNDQNR